MPMATSFIPYLYFGLWMHTHIHTHVDPSPFSKNQWCKKVLAVCRRRILHT